MECAFHFERPCPIHIECIHVYALETTTTVPIVSSSRSSIRQTVARPTRWRRLKKRLQWQITKRSFFDSNTEELRNMSTQYFYFLRRICVLEYFYFHWSKGREKSANLEIQVYDYWYYLLILRRRKSVLWVWWPTIIWDLTRYNVVFTPFTATVFILSILHDVLLENKDNDYHQHDCEDFEKTLINTLHCHIMSCQNMKREEDHRCILTWGRYCIWASNSGLNWLSRLVKWGTSDIQAI